MSVKCPFPGCTYETDEEGSEAIKIAYLSAHQISHMPGANVASNPTPRIRTPVLDRPKVDVGVSAEEWNIFTRRWDVFVQGSGLVADDCSPQLFQCAAENLGDALLKTKPDITSKPTDELLAAMKSLAVIAVAPGVIRADANADAPGS